MNKRLLDESYIGKKFYNKRKGYKVIVEEIINNGRVAICREINLLSGLDVKVHRIGRVIMLEDMEEVRA